MGFFKQLDIRIRSGGDDAIAAACELADLAKEQRGYEDTMNATEDITDIVTVLRGVGFAAVDPSAGDSASLLHYCVTHAADEIERLREERRWIPVGERLPDDIPHGYCLVTDGTNVGTANYSKESRRWDHCIDRDYWKPTHWMPLPAAPTDDK